jgi:hypothetical protein
MKPGYLFSIIFLGSFSLVSCSGSSNGSSGNSAAATAGASSDSASTISRAPASLSQEDAENLSGYVSDASSSDVQNAQIGDQIRFGGGGFFGFVIGDLMMMSNASCVTVAKTNSAGTEETLQTFKCPYITGTTETTNTTSATTDSFSIVSKLVLGMAPNSRTVNSTLSTSKVIATGVLNSSKTFDDLFSDAAADKYEAKGTASEVFTPTKLADPMNGGAVVINHSVDLYKNGVEIGLFSVASNGLEYSLCGFNAGSITIVNDSNKCVITFSGCGHPNIACSSPAASPSPSPSPSPSVSPAAN